MKANLLNLKYRNLVEKKMKHFIDSDLFFCAWWHEVTCSHIPPQSQSKHHDSTYSECNSRRLDNEIIDGHFDFLWKDKEETGWDVSEGKAGADTALAPRTRFTPADWEPNWSASVMETPRCRAPHLFSALCWPAAAQTRRRCQLLLVSISAAADSYECCGRDYSWPNREITPLLNNEAPQKQPGRTESLATHTTSLIGLEWPGPFPAWRSGPAEIYCLFNSRGNYI